MNCAGIYILWNKFLGNQVPINEENKFLLTLNRYIYHVLFTYIIIRYSPFTYSTLDINNEKYIQSVKISQHENILNFSDWLKKTQAGQNTYIFNI